VILDEKAKLISSLQSVKTCNDMVFFQSGYNTHDLEGGREDVMHQLVINAFQDIPIIMSRIRIGLLFLIQVILLEFSRV
jgi:hypothetical protein